jgi:hypothetical protein
VRIHSRESANELGRYDLHETGIQEKICTMVLQEISNETKILSSFILVEKLSMSYGEIGFSKFASNCWCVGRGIVGKHSDNLHPAKRMRFAEQIHRIAAAARHHDDSLSSVRFAVSAPST